MNNQLRAGIAAALLPVGIALVAPSASAAPAAPAPYWTCTFTVVESGVDSDSIAQVTPKAGEAPHAVGDVLSDFEDVVLVGSTGTKPTEAGCLAVMRDFVSGVHDPARSVAVWNCAYQLTQAGPVFMKDALEPGGSAVRLPNPFVRYVTPSDAKAFPVGATMVGEGILDIVVAQTPRGAAEPTRADCDAALPAAAAKAGIAVPKPSAKPSAKDASTKPSRGVSAKTGDESDAAPAVALAVAMASLTGGAVCRRVRRG